MAPGSINRHIIQNLDYAQTFLEMAGAPIPGDMQGRSFKSMLLGEPAPSGPSGFSDVPTGEFYSDAVAWAAENGITTGYGDGTFRPDQPVTRGEMATFLLRLALLVEALAPPA